jgi:hypothetical protein
VGRYNDFTKAGNRRVESDTRRQHIENLKALRDEGGDAALLFYCQDSTAPPYKDITGLRTRLAKDHLEALRVTDEAVEACEQAFSAVGPVKVVDEASAVLDGSAGPYTGG